MFDGKYIKENPNMNRAAATAPKKKMAKKD